MRIDLRDDLKVSNYSCRIRREEQEANIMEQTLCHDLAAIWARFHSYRAPTASITATSSRIETTSHSADPLPLSGSVPKTVSIQSCQKNVMIARIPATEPNIDSNQNRLRRPANITPP
jgi:hypothetical protein